MKYKLSKNLLCFILLLIAIVNIVFTTKVYADSASTLYSFQFKTNLSNQTLEDGMFNYTISSKNNGPLPSNVTATNNGENVIFSPITFNESHVGNIYYYTISQDESSYFKATPTSYECSIRVYRDSDNNIIATENILKNTNNVNANQLGGFTWDIGGWRVGSGGDGKGSIHTLDDVPTYERTVFRIYDNTTGNKDWVQSKLPYVNGNEYTVSGYARIPTESSNESANLLIRIWDSTQSKSLLQKKVTINKSNGWVPYSYAYVFNGTENNSSYQVGITGAGDIELNGLRVESTQFDMLKNFSNEYTGVPITVLAKTKNGLNNNNFTFKVKAWTGDETPEYIDLTTQGLTSIGNNEYTFTVESNSESSQTFDIPKGYDYEISLVNTDEWIVYSVDGNKTKLVASNKVSAANTHNFIIASEPIDIKVKKLDENNEYLSNAVLRVSEETATIKQWITESEDHTISLTDGTYTLKEITAPNGYNKAADIEFVIRDKKLFINDVEISNKTITMIDTPKPRFKFAKQDSVTNEFLKNAWLVISKKEMPVASFYSTDDYYEIYLDNGNYTFNEKISPTGYKLSNPVNFSVENGVLKDANGNVVDAIIMKDDIAKGKLILTKKDASDNNKLLPNAKYRFWGTDFDGKQIEMEITTDENGIAVIENLPLGNYHYQEIEAPVGYELDDTVYDISLSSNASPLDDATSTVTTKELCKISSSNEQYYYYDYDNGSYSTEKSYYKDYLGDGSIYVGGNGFSATGSEDLLDNDPNDFTRILPYGNVFINTDKLVFSNASILFPVDSPFHLIKKGDKEIGVDGTVISDSIYNNSKVIDDGQISYLGYLKSYIKGVGAPEAYGSANYGQLTEDGFNALINGGDKEDGTKAQHYDDHVVKEYGNTIVNYKDGQNIITNAVDGYVYKVIYQDATVLPDGSIGDLVLTVDEVIMESAVDKLENIAYGIQRANQFSSNPAFGFNNETNDTPASSRYPRFVFSPNASNKSTTSATGTYKTRNGIGVSIQWSLSAIDKSGNAVDGSISYSVKDLDLRGVDNVWGRVKGTEYAEGMEIVSGSKSFAVMPYYEHANAGNTINEGYAFGSDLAIKVERVKSGSNADGLRFYTPTYVRWRDANGVKIGSVTSTSENSNGTKIDNKASYEALDSNSGRYYLIRGDYGTFDSGFAVLLDASGSTLRWTGSSGVSQTDINTQIFDSSAYVRLQQAHGTGGDLYVEAYDYENNCELRKIRRDMTMGIGESTTLTMEPQDGWEIEKITIDGTTVMFTDLTFNDSGVATYDFNGTTYTFTKDETNPKKVRVTFNDVQENHAISVDYTPSIDATATNEKAYGDLIINKKDVDTGKLLADVEFTLSGTSDLNETVNIIKKTDNNGQIKIENIPAGKYKLHETTPEYYKEVEDQEVVIARDASTKEVTLDILNEGIKRDLIIKKIVSGTDKDENQSFNINVKLFDRDNKIVKRVFTVLVNDEEKEIEANKNGLNISIKHDDTIIIKNININYSYEITEEDTDYTEFYNIKTKTEVIENTTEGNSAKGVLKDETTITFTNKKDKIEIPKDNTESSNETQVVPKTYDNINTYVRLLVFGLIGTFFSIKAIRSKKIYK